MQVYYVKRFSAIVVATGRMHAFNLLAEKLKENHRYTLGFKDISPNEFIQLDVNDPHAVLLTSGFNLVDG